MLVRDNNGRHYPLSFYAPMSLHSFPSDNEAAYIRLYPVLDALSLLFLQPENLGAARLTPMQDLSSQADRSSLKTISD